MPTTKFSDSISRLGHSLPGFGPEELDSNLLTRFMTRRDESVFEELVRRHRSKVFGVSDRPPRTNRPLDATARASKSAQENRWLWSSSLPFQANMVATASVIIPGQDKNGLKEKDRWCQSFVKAIESKDLRNVLQLGNFHLLE